MITVGNKALALDICRPVLTILRNHIEKTNTRKAISRNADNRNDASSSTSHETAEYAATIASALDALDDAAVALAVLVFEVGELCLTPAGDAATKPSSSATQTDGTTRFRSLFKSLVDAAASVIRLVLLQEVADSTNNNSCNNDEQGRGNGEIDDHVRCADECGAALAACVAATVAGTLLTALAVDLLGAHAADERDAQKQQQHHNQQQSSSSFPWWPVHLLPAPLDITRRALLHVEQALHLASHCSHRHYSRRPSFPPSTGTAASTLCRAFAALVWATLGDGLSVLQARADAIVWEGVAAAAHTTAEPTASAPSGDAEEATDERRCERKLQRVDAFIATVPLTSSSSSSSAINGATTFFPDRGSFQQNTRRGDAFGDDHNDNNDSDALLHALTLHYDAKSGLLVLSGLPRTLRGGGGGGGAGHAGMALTPTHHGLEAGMSSSLAATPPPSPGTLHSSLSASSTGALAQTHHHERVSSSLTTGSNSEVAPLSATPTAQLATGDFDEGITSGRASLLGCRVRAVTLEPRLWQHWHSLAAALGNRFHNITQRPVRVLVRVPPPPVPGDADDDLREGTTPTPTLLLTEVTKQSALLRAVALSATAAAPWLDLAETIPANAADDISVYGVALGPDAERGVVIDERLWTRMDCLVAALERDPALSDAWNRLGCALAEQEAAEDMLLEEGAACGHYHHHHHGQSHHATTTGGSSFGGPGGASASMSVVFGALDTTGPTTAQDHAPQQQEQQLQQQQCMALPTVANSDTGDVPITDPVRAISRIGHSGGLEAVARSGTGASSAGGRNPPVALIHNVAHTKAQCFTRAVSINPEDGMAWNNLGLTLDDDSDDDGTGTDGGWSKRRSSKKAGLGIMSGDDALERATKGAAERVVSIHGTLYNRRACLEVAARLGCEVADNNLEELFDARDVAGHRNARRKAQREKKKCVIS